MREIRKVQSVYYLSTTNIQQKQKCHTAVLVRAQQCVSCGLEAHSLLRLSLEGHMVHFLPEGQRKRENLNSVTLGTFFFQCESSSLRH